METRVFSKRSNGRYEIALLNLTNNIGLSKTKREKLLKIVKI